MSRKKILLLGASGQLGQQLLKRLPAQYVVDAPTHAQLDITNESSVACYLLDSRPYAVINAAAFTAVDACETNCQLAYAVNAEGARWVAVYACKAGAKLLHISTDYVFDGSSTRAYQPTDVCRPINQYGRSKLAGEQAVLQAMPSAIVLRTAWLYSEDGHNFVKTILKAAQRNQPMQVVDDQLGSPTYAGHLAEAVFRLIELPVPGGIYHFAGARAMSWHQLAQYVVDEASLLSEAYAPRRIARLCSAQLQQEAQRPRYSVLDSTGLKAFGLSPSDLALGVQETLTKLLKTQS